MKSVWGRGGEGLESLLWKPSLGISDRCGNLHLFVSNSAQLLCRNQVWWCGLLPGSVSGEILLAYPAVQRKLKLVILLINMGGRFGTSSGLVIVGWAGRGYIYISNRSKIDIHLFFLVFWTISYWIDTSSIRDVELKLIILPNELHFQNPDNLLVKIKIISEDMEAKLGLFWGDRVAQLLRGTRTRLRRPQSLLRIDVLCTGNLYLYSDRRRNFVKLAWRKIIDKGHIL